MNEQDRSEMARVLAELRKPFHPSQVTWKPGAVKGERALALAYADLRAYMNRLDEVVGYDWSVSYEPWGESRVICRLTILGVTRSSTGETSNEAERSEIGGTVAEAQAFKRACAMFGLGRYLYNLPTGWADYDPAKKQFTDKGKAKLMGLLVQHYRRATEGGGTNADALFAATGDLLGETETATEPASELLQALDDAGRAYYGDRWPHETHKWIVWANSAAETVGDLTAAEIERIISSINQRAAKRKTAA